MRRKKTICKRVHYNEQDNFNLIKSDDGLIFEVGKEMTTDIAEAVAIAMRKIDWNSKIWNMKIPNNINHEHLTPEKSLFWLTGGYQEWRTLTHYNRPWSECYLNFQEEFGFLIINIVKRSKNLGDIRNGFVKYLNLPTLYNFAISKKMITN